jgi:DNA polymerase-3 subunit chi
MTEINFYHLMHTPLERALSKLMEKVVDSGTRAVIRARSVERAEALSNALWTLDRASFIPHGSARDGNAAEQPLWITLGNDNLNHADILVITDGADRSGVNGFRRCLEMFDGRDDGAVADARRHWSEYKSGNHDLTYWQQTDEGGWEKKA